MSPILLADDDADEAYLVARAFREAGIANELLTVPDAEAAIACLEARNGHATPCLVLLDQKLPGRSGLEVLEWIRNRSPNPTLPVLLLSASTYESDVQAAYLVGANGYLVKPASYEGCIAMAKAVKDYWLTFNRSPTLR